MTANGDITQPIQWSSEYADTDLALVYYNYRHYNPMDGRWLGRDLVEEYRQSLSRYLYTDNNSVWRIDNLGNSWFSDAIDWVVEEVSHVVKVTMDTFNKI